MGEMVTIVGGGIAGLTLGIALRQLDLPVTIYEAGHLPRHRVCGEFLSGKGLDLLQELQLLDKIFKAGAQTASTVSFHTANRSSKIHNLPSPALCLSRYRFDLLLAQEFRRLGGDLRLGSRWTASFSSPGIIRATGRRPARAHGEHVIGLKIHARNLELLSDLEMHFSSRAYFGLCRVEDEKVNLCGLFRLPANESELPRERSQVFAHYANPSLRERLLRARFDDHSFCAVAALPLSHSLPTPGSEWPIGDSVSMIPPLTGNGMSLALESALLSLPPLTKYARGELSWNDALILAHQDYRRSFASRLHCAETLHKSLFSPFVQSLLLAGVEALPPLLPYLFRKTRA